MPPAPIPQESASSPPGARSRLILRFLLLACASVAIIAAVASHEGVCGGCRPGAAAVAIPGILVYVALLVGNETGLRGSIVTFSAWYMLGGHGYLVGLLVGEGKTCLLCMASALLCGGLAWLSRRHWKLDWRACVLAMLAGALGVIGWMRLGGHP